MKKNIKTKIKRNLQDKDKNEEKLIDCEKMIEDVIKTPGETLKELVDDVRKLRLTDKELNEINERVKLAELHLLPKRIKLTDEQQDGLLVGYFYELGISTKH